MGTSTGMVAVGVYAGAANDAAAVDVLINLIPNPDAILNQQVNSSGAIAGGTFLDQMSPACAAALRVELAALRDAIDTTNNL